MYKPCTSPLHCNQCIFRYLRKHDITASQICLNMYVWPSSLDEHLLWSKRCWLMFYSLQFVLQSLEIFVHFSLYLKTLRTCSELFLVISFLLVLVIILKFVQSKTCVFAWISSRTTDLYSLRSEGRLIIQVSRLVSCAIRFSVQYGAWD